MAAIRLTVNGRDHAVDIDPDTPLVWVLRDTLGLTGTKFGCGMGQCGCCTVHLDGEAARACVTTATEAQGRRVTTIEGLASGAPHPLQKAWVEARVAQCGWCQPGQIMTAAALLAKTPDPGDADIDAALLGNLCRCGTYRRVRRAVQAAAREARR
jgi:isoquinoline 1-oxidoreductase alpha subunit